MRGMGESGSFGLRWPPSHVQVGTTRAKWKDAPLLDLGHGLDPAPAAVVTAVGSGDLAPFSGLPDVLAGVPPACSQDHGRAFWHVSGRGCNGPGPSHRSGATFPGLPAGRKGFLQPGLRAPSRQPERGGRPWSEAVFHPGRWRLLPAGDGLPGSDARFLWPAAHGSGRGVHGYRPP